MKSESGFSLTAMASQPFPLKVPKLWNLLASWNFLRAGWKIIKTACLLTEQMLSKRNDTKQVASPNVIYLADQKA